MVFPFSKMPVQEVGNQVTYPSQVPIKFHTASLGHESTILSLIELSTRYGFSTNQFSYNLMSIPPAANRIKDRRIGNRTWSWSLPPFHILKDVDRFISKFDSGRLGVIQIAQSKSVGKSGDLKNSKKRSIWAEVTLPVDSSGMASCLKKSTPSVS